MKRLTLLLIALIGIIMMSGCQKAIYPINGIIEFAFESDSLEISTSAGECTIKNMERQAYLFDGFIKGDGVLTIQFRQNGNVSTFTFRLAANEAVTFNVRFVLTAIHGIELPMPSPI